MDLAIDRSGQRVRATAAHRGGSYLCAQCRVRVVYAAGLLQAPHFRHSPRTPAERERTESCPLYVADQQGEPGGFARHTPEPPAPPRPRLAFNWAASESARQRWGLLVTVPSPPAGVSFVQVGENLNGGVDVTREYVQARRSVWVKARSIQYRVTGYDGTRRTVWNPEPTDLLRANEPNIFQAGANGGSQLEPGEPLVRGGTYLAVSRLPTSKAPPEKLSRAVSRLDACDPKRDWEGRLVYIPVRRDPEIEHWAESVCKRRIVDPPPRLEVVLPPLRSLGPDGVYELDSGQEIILATCGGAWVEPVLELVDEETGRAVEWPMEVSDGDYISLGMLPPGRFTAHLREWEYVSVRLLTVPAARTDVAAVTLRTAPLSGGPDLEASLLSSDASERWANLICGRELSRGIDAPDGWPVKVSWKPKGRPKQAVAGIVHAASLAETLSDCLASDPDHAELDAGPFGHVAWRRSPGLAPPAAKVRRMPASLDARLTWLLASQQAMTGPRVPLGLELRAAWIGRVAAPHSRLLARFLRVSAWPPGLLPLARSAGRELTGLLE